METLAKKNDSGGPKETQKRSKDLDQHRTWKKIKKFLRADYQGFQHLGSEMEKPFQKNAPPPPGGFN